MLMRDLFAVANHAFWFLQRNHSLPQKCGFSLNAPKNVCSVVGVFLWRQFANRVKSFPFYPKSPMQTLG